MRRIMFKISRNVYKVIRVCLIQARAVNNYSGSFSVFFFCRGALLAKQKIGNDFIQEYDSRKNVEQMVEGIGKLTTSLLHDIYTRNGKGFNIALSPISIWTTLVMLLEGAAGKTENELKTKLKVFYRSPVEGKQLFRNRHNMLMNYLQGGKNSKDFTSINFIITNILKSVNPSYINTMLMFYGAQGFSVDPALTDKFSDMINTWASGITNYQIQELVTPDLLENLSLMVGNAVYFHSKWKYPFDPTNTVFLPFMDNQKNIKQIEMMSRLLVLPYYYNKHLESQIVEIPYHDDRLSMIVILPQQGVSLKNVLSKMRYMSLEKIMPRNASDENVDLFLPKFHISSRIQLKDLLKQDLQSIFNPSLAEFPRIGKYIYVNEISHKAEIKNTEEGTSASGVSSVQFAFKSLGIPFQANRAFIYLINDIRTRTILFAGTYTNPYRG